MEKNLLIFMIIMWWVKNSIGLSGNICFIIINSYVMGEKRLFVVLLNREC